MTQTVIGVIGSGRGLIMSLDGAVQDAILPVQTIIWNDQNGNAVDLSTATITGQIENVSTGVAKAITGVFVVTDGPAGTFTWTYSAADVGTGGAHRVQFTATFAGGDSKTILEDWFVYRKI